MNTRICSNWIRGKDTLVIRRCNADRFKKMPNLFDQDLRTHINLYG
jgi:hypothetical protein